jgi:hypothetical protein
MACVLGFWRIASDFKATGEFPIDSGLFSHWQVWLGSAGFIQLCAVTLNRFGKPADEQQPGANDGSSDSCGDSPHPASNQTAF